MSLRLSTFALIVLLPCSFAPWRSLEAASDNDQQAALTQLENKWLAAEDDPATLESILADDLIHVLPNGFVTKQEQLSYMRTHPSLKRETRRFEDLRVRIFGTAAVVNGIVIASAEGGKPHRTIFTDVFAYRNGRWQAVNAQELPLNH